MSPPIHKLSHEEISRQRLTLPEIPSVERYPIVGLLDNVRSLYNVGSIFRTSDGARVQSLVLTGFTPHPPRKEIEKTALGATHSVPWEYHKDPQRAIGILRENGVRICVLEHTDSGVPYTAIRPDQFPLCLVVGNELTGVSPALIHAADLAIDIPMHGIKQSLNVAVAYGIAVFELARIWIEQEPISGRRTPG